MTRDTKANPCGLQGFAFLEFSGSEPQFFEGLFGKMGFQAHPLQAQGDVMAYEQGNTLFLVNAAKNAQAAQHSALHGSAACAMGFLVDNAENAFSHAIRQGAVPYEDSDTRAHGLPAIEAIGGSIIYFADKQLKPFGLTPSHEHHGAGLGKIDHLTHNVKRGRMDYWADFYAEIFNFSQIRYFDIEGQMTGLVSRAIASPGGHIKIPLNESKDDHSQIEEFLHAFHGEGIQHIALTTDNIYNSVATLKQNGLQFLDVPDTYYEMLDARLPWHQEAVKELQKLKILMDGGKEPKDGLLLQIFTENAMGPVFFEIIQRKGNDGFGEGNFQALFEAIERDQMRRGTLPNVATEKTS